MTVSRRFLRVAAACWMVSALTTLALIFLPRLVAPAPDLEGQLRLVHDPIYMARLGVALFHPLIVLVGALGALAARSREAMGSAATGFLFFVLWAATEAVQQALTLVTLNWAWRTRYLEAPDETARQALRLYIGGFDAVSDGLFFFLLLAFIAANLCFAVATWHGPALQRTVAVFFGLAAGLGVISLATRFGAGVLPPGVMAVLYPSIQPLGRFVTGVWLWRTARDVRPDDAADSVPRHP